jgi:7-dehydrocholesterol reductase
MIHKEGSLTKFMDELATEGLWGGVLSSMPKPSFTGRATQLVGAYALFEALLLIFMPGKTFYGPVTAGGNRPVYKARPWLAGARSGLQLLAKPVTCRRLT